MDDAERGQLDLSAAEVYDEFFVPALFEEWGPRVADAAGIAARDRVLDVACGTGVLARAAHALGASVTGLDCNAAMLAIARRRDAGVDWRDGRAEELPFDDGSFDVVVSQFGLMFFQDRDAALAEMRRVLRPGGRLAIAVWASLDETPGYADMTRLIARLFGERVADALRAPYRLGDAGRFAASIREAGFTDVAVVREQGTARYPSIDEWVRMDVKGWTLGDLIDDEQFARLKETARSELGAHVGDDGAVEFAAPALIGIGAR